MKIRSFTGLGLHGYLNVRLDFANTLTFLTGINGSGKTSAVRAITALLAPSLRELANMSFQSLQVNAEVDGQEVRIEVQQSETEIILTCSGETDGLRIPILRQDNYETASSFRDREHAFYREQEALNSRQNVLRRIEALPTPMFLDLDRRNQHPSRRRRTVARSTGTVRYSTGAATVNPFAGGLIDSLTDAQELAEDAYRLLLTRRTKLTDNLKQDIILTAFRLNTGGDIGVIGRPSRSFFSELEKTKGVVHEALSQVGISEDRLVDSVAPFFERVREVAEQLPSEKELQNRTLDNEKIKRLQDWSAIQPQFRQINRLLALVELYNSSLRSLFEPVEAYLDSVNQFLSDSRKSIKFGPAGNLQVVLDQDGVPRPVNALSSGERQLVVILTHLAFNHQARRANVLIIDEPELSLHLRWQELFVDAVTKASPGLQMILATHSPSIIRGRLAHCIDIEEARVQ